MTEDHLVTKGSIAHYVAALHFDMTTIEGQQQHRLALQGAAWNAVVNDLQQQLRSWIKYGNDFKTVDEALENVRGALCRIITDRLENIE